MLRRLSLTGWRLHRPTRRSTRRALWLHLSITFPAKIRPSNQCTVSQVKGKAGQFNGVGGRHLLFQTTFTLDCTTGSLLFNIPWILEFVLTHLKYPSSTFAFRPCIQNDKMTKFFCLDAAGSWLARPIFFVFTRSKGRGEGYFFFCLIDLFHNFVRLRPRALELHIPKVRFCFLFLGLIVCLGHSYNGATFLPPLNQKS